MKNLRIASLARVAALLKAILWQLNEKEKTSMRNNSIFKPGAGALERFKSCWKIAAMSVTIICCSVLTIQCDKLASTKESSVQVYLNPPKNLSRLIGKSERIMSWRSDGAQRLSGNNLQFLSSNNEILHEVTVEKDPSRYIDTRVVPTRSGKFIGLHTTRGVNGDSWESADFTVFDAKGNERWKIHNPPVGQLVLSPKGDVAVGLPMGEGSLGAPVFYSAEGIHNLSMFDKKQTQWPAHYHAEGVSFSSDGERVVIAARRPPGKHQIQLYDSQSHELWRKENITDPQLSFTGNYIAAKCFQTDSRPCICLIDKTGRTLWTLPQTDRGAYYFAFSEDESLLVYAMGFGHIGIVNTATGNTVWRWQDNKPPLADGNLPFAIDGLKVNRDAKIIAVGGFLCELDQSGQEKRSSDRILIFSKGNILADTAYPPDSIPYIDAGTPTYHIMDFVLSEDGHWLIVPQSAGNKIYEIKSANGAVDDK